MEKLNESESPAHHGYYKYYRVDKNDTSVTEVSANDFQRIKLSRDQCKEITLQHDYGIYSLYTDLAQAMEKAKSGAQAYIEQLIAKGDEGLSELLQYRVNHYEDLNVNLVEANIKKEEGEMKGDQNFEYKPYRIDSSTPEDPA